MQRASNVEQENILYFLLKCRLRRAEWKYAEETETIDIKLRQLAKENSSEQSVTVKNSSQKLKLTNWYLTAKIPVKIDNTVAKS